MKIEYKLAGLRLFGILLIGIFLSACSSPKQSEADLLLQNTMDMSRFVTSDELAKRIINNDPSISIIDVRSLYEYDEYYIPGAVSIPLEEILIAENEEHFNKEYIEVILYSNADIFADQAWFLLNEKGFDNVYILKGGLNTWFKTIMLPVEPMQDAQKADHELYSFRKGASLYFGGSVQELPIAVERSTGENTATPKTKKTVVVKKKVKKQAEGGC